MTTSTISFIKLLVGFVIVVGYAIVSKYYLYDFALKLDVSIIKAQIGVLVNVSAILFGVVGAWLALIYPTALQKVQGNESVELAYSGINLQLLKSLVVILFFSTVALVLSMLADLALTLSTMDWVSQYLGKDNLIAICAITIWFLFFIQISAISSILWSSFKLVYDLFVSKAFSDLEGLLTRNKR